MASAKAQMPPVREEELHAYLTLRRQWAEDPVRYAVERLGLRPTWQQKKLFEALAPEGAKVSCRAGHGIGKSGCTSGAALWFLETRDYAKIPCTAPTSHQLRDVLVWGMSDRFSWLRSFEPRPDGEITRGNPTDVELKVKPLHAAIGAALAGAAAR